MNESIMPLVEENRKLHDEVRALKIALADQNVRVDEMITNPARYALHYLDVEVSQHTLLAIDLQQARRLIAHDLAEMMVAHMPRMAMKIEAPIELGKSLVYRFAFLKVGK